jgi:hypothetical protein
MPGQPLGMLFAYTQPKPSTKAAPPNTPMKALFKTTRFQAGNAMSAIMRAPASSCSACGR